MMPNHDGLSDREAAIDAMTRFVVSLDDGDAEMLAGSITEDMLMDLSPFNKAGNFNYQPFSGRELVVDRLMKAVGKSMDSTHSITNFQCAVKGDVAQLSCYVLAQHFRLGQGPSSDYQDFYLMGNRYKAEAVREGEWWKVKKLIVTPAWTQGVPAVMNV